MRVKMNYFILMLIPLCFCLITLLLQHIEKAYFPFNTALLSVHSVMFTVGLVIAVPVYLIVLNSIFIFRFDLATWKGLVFSVLAILLNAVICFPYSVWSYITHGKYITRGTNDLNLFPVYAGIPILIVGIAVIVMKIVAVVKSK